MKKKKKKKQQNKIIQDGVKGIVVKSTGSWYDVKTDTERIKCKIRGKLRTWGLKTTNPVAVGDYVLIKKLEDGTGLIYDILERKRCIIRKSARYSRQEHLMACNVDQAMLIATINYPETHLEFIDRFLVSAEAYNIPEKVIIFNKIDLYNDEELKKLEEYTEIYTKIGYKVLHTSALKKINLDKVIELLKDKITVIVGNSGVGKSTLINAIDPNLNLKTSEISRKYKTGRHTTTFPEMFELVFGGYIIDTPGIRAFGLANFNKYDIAHNFPEMFKYLPKCRYRNCLHIDEPGCAVKEAVQKGEIPISRYRSYLKIILDEDSKYRKDEFQNW